MPPLLIAQLIIALGPSAIQLIQQLVAVWNKPTLTVDEVMAICSVASKTPEQYLAQAQAKAIPAIPPKIA